MKLSRVVLSLLVLALGAGSAFAQALVVNAGWEVFVIREGATEPPLILDNDDYEINAIEIMTTESGQKAGLATNQLNGATISQIATLHVDRLDDVQNSGSLYGPYFNIWVTDGLGHYAVLANEPSDAEWASGRWDVPDWDFLRTKRCKVWETPGASGGEAGTSWIFDLTGVSTGLVFDDVADLVIAPPPVSYITEPLNGVGTGAPDELGTNIAYGYTWVFGDTAANYVTGGDGFIVDNYYATTDFAVRNVTQGTFYSTIEAALAAAADNDVITIDDGTYNPPTTLAIDRPLTLTGESEAGVIINIPAAGGYGMTVTANDITLQGFTLAAAADNPNYPIHASGTAAPGGLNDLTIQNVTISGDHERTCFDVHGFTTVVLSHLTANDSYGGNGLQVTGCVDVTIDNLTALNNAWGSLAIYCSDVGYLDRPSSNVAVDGLTLNLDGAFFSQDEFGFVNTNITVSGWSHEVQNSHFREAIGYTDSAGYTFFAADQAMAYAIATGFTGYEMYSAMFNTVTGEWEVVPGLTIKAAVDHALDGDTVGVAAGTYLESGQIVIDRNLTITGADAATTIVNKAEDSGDTGSGNDRGWFLVTAGNTLNMSGLTLDGVGNQICIAILSFGSVNVSDSVITNIGWTPTSYYGRAICLYGETTSAISRVDFSNILRIGVFSFYANTVTNISECTYTGKGDGDWLDYAFEAGGGAVVNATDCTVTACTGVASVDESGSAGLLFSTYWGPGTSGTVTDCTLTGNTVGVYVGYETSDTSEVTVVGCSLTGNTDQGVYTTAPLVTAVGNWWGHASGPLDASDDTGTGGLYNPNGLGDAVSDNVNYDPWVGMGSVAITPATSGPLTCGLTETLTFSLTMDDYTPDVFMYNAVVRATGEVSFGAVGDQFPFGHLNNWFSAADNGDGSWTITGSTVGSPTYPVTDTGVTDLFTIDFVTVTDGTADITFDSLVLRDPTNATIPMALSGASILVDCTAPLAVTDITAVPHHNRVEVGWTHNDVDVAYYWIYHGMWYDTTPGTPLYPEYNDMPGATVPARPVAGLPDPGAGWVRVDGDAVPFAVDSFFDVFVQVPADLQRGVYYYEVYAVDAAGNVSPPAAANAHATNYWLGDMTPGGGNADGFVKPVEDISVLGAAFGEVDGGVDYNPFCDVGPTDDWSRVGIPDTDNKINFEDLMVFSMNFGVVSDLNKAKGDISTTATLAWVDTGDDRFVLRLVDGTGIKGVHVRASLPEGTISGVMAGDLLDEQNEMTFLRNIGTALDASVSVMGVDNGFVGSGDLLVVESSAAIAATSLAIEVRGYDNSSLKVSLSQTSGTVTPRVFALEANYPNPFNPMTKISFSLPEAQNVQLSIYSIDGTRVATLVNEVRAAGLHEVLWMGRDDAGQAMASGLYFYRIEAGPYSQVRKMTLMK